MFLYRNRPRSLSRCRSRLEPKRYLMTTPPNESRAITAKPLMHIFNTGLVGKIPSSRSIPTASPVNAIVPMNKWTDKSNELLIYIISYSACLSNKY